MKKFGLKIFLFALSFLITIELISRVIIDPIYFSKLDTYRAADTTKCATLSCKLKKKYNPSSPHIDYLFIGSSRVPATIDDTLIMDREPGKTAVVAGRGYSTPGTHYQALRSKLSKDPNFLKGTKVFIEYPGSGIYAESFTENRMKVFEPIVANEAKPMPNLLIPYLDSHSLIEFFQQSKNSIGVKIDVAMLRIFSSYRCADYMNEKFNRFGDYFKRDNNKPKDMVAEGGIRNDNFEHARWLAMQVADLDTKRIESSPGLTDEMLHQSCLYYMTKLIQDNGGEVFLYEMPLCSIQANIYKAPKSQQNKLVFEKWISSQGIKVVRINQFNYTDSDFPDSWHLRAGRRDEFTSRLLDEFHRL